eukprot:814150_1
MNRYPNDASLVVIVETESVSVDHPTKYFVDYSEFATQKGWFQTANNYTTQPYRLLFGIDNHLLDNGYVILNGYYDHYVVQYYIQGQSKRKSRGRSIKMNCRYVHHYHVH